MRRQFAKTVRPCEIPPSRKTARVLNVSGGSLQQFRLIAIGAIVGLATPVVAQEEPGYQEIGYGETVSDFLTADDFLFEDGTSYKIYLFDGGAGDTVTIQLLSADFNAQLIVVDSSYNPLADDRDSGGHGERCGQHAENPRRCRGPGGARHGRPNHSGFPPEHHGK